MNIKTKTISYNSRVYLFWILATVSVLSLGAYIYAINATARSIATSQVLERRITDLSAELDSLEFSYLQLKNNVTIELAKLYGFREVRNPLYVSRDRSLSLSFNTLNQ